MLYAVLKVLIEDWPVKETDARSTEKLSLLTPCLIATVRSFTFVALSMVTVYSTTTLPALWETKHINQLLLWLCSWQWHCQHCGKTKHINHLLFSPILNTTDIGQFTFLQVYSRLPIDMCQNAESYVSIKTKHREMSQSANNATTVYKI